MSYCCKNSAMGMGHDRNCANNPKTMESAPSTDERLDREYRNGFLAGWNAAQNNDEKKLKAVQSRLNV